MQVPVVRISDSRNGMIAATLYFLTVLFLLFFIKYVEPDPPKETVVVPIIMGEEGIEDFEISSAAGGGGSNETEETNPIIDHSSINQETQEKSEVQVVKGKDSEKNASSQKETQPNPFSGDNSNDDGSGGTGGNQFGPDAGTGGSGNQGGTTEMGKNRVRLTNIKTRPQTHNDEIVFIALKLIVDTEGKVLRAECIRKNTTTTNQNLIDEVIQLVEDEVTYAKRPNGKIEIGYYTIKVSPGGSVSYN